MIEMTRLPNESDEYRARREELRVAELELMRQQERVAAMRRSLPADTAVDDYELVDARSGSPVRLSELFTGPGRDLIVYHYMFGKAQTEACPMCTMWIDGFDRVSPHVAQGVDFAVVAAAEPDVLRAWADGRGWRDVRLLSAGTSTFKYDFASEDADGVQDSTVSVFTRAADGTIRHTYSGHPWMGDGVHERGIDLLTPVWAVFDLTPGGRPDWYPSLTYGG